MLPNARIFVVDGLSLTAVIKGSTQIMAPCGGDIVMAASITLILVGIGLLGGDWPSLYPIFCIVTGIAWWHVTENKRRQRLARETRIASPEVVSARRACAATAATLEVAAILSAGGLAFDNADAGLFGGSAGAFFGALLIGGGLLALAAQINRFKRALNATRLHSWRLRVGALLR